MPTAAAKVDAEAGRQRHDRRRDRRDRQGDRGRRGTSPTSRCQSVTGGGDALGEWSSQLRAEGRKVTGRGVATDVVEASARAYLAAVNKLVRLRAAGTTERFVESTP